MISNKINKILLFLCLIVSIISLVGCKEEKNESVDLISYEISFGGKKDVDKVIFVGEEGYISYKGLTKLLYKTSFNNDEENFKSTPKEEFVSIPLAELLTTHLNIKSDKGVRRIEYLKYKNQGFFSVNTFANEFGYYFSIKKEDKKIFVDKTDESPLYNIEFISNELVVTNLNNSYKKSSRDEVIEDFENSTKWIGRNAKFENDENIYKYGHKSLKISNVEPGKPAYIDRKILSSFYEKEFTSIWIYTEDIETFTGIALYLSSSNFKDGHFETVIKRRWIQNGWNFIKIKKDDWKKVGNEDWGNQFSNFRTGLFPINGRVGTIWLDAWFQAGKNKSYGMLVFDDGYKSVYTLAKKHNVKYEIPMTVGIIKNLVDVNQNYMSLGELKSLYKDGHDIVSHTTSHVPLVDKPFEVVKNEIVTCRDYLRNNGFNRSADFLIFPEGKFDRENIKYLQEFEVKAARGVTLYQEFTPSSNIYNMKIGFELDRDTTFDEVKQAVDRVVKNGGLCIIMAHNIGDVSFNQYTASENFYKKILEYISSQEIEMLTYSQWYNKEVEVAGKTTNK